MHQPAHFRSECLAHFVAVISQPQSGFVQSLKQQTNKQKMGGTLHEVFNVSVI